LLLVFPLLLVAFFFSTLFSLLTMFLPTLFVFPTFFFF